MDRREGTLDGVLVDVVQPAGSPTWRGETHLLAHIAGAAVLACTGDAAGTSVKLVPETVEDGLACEACRRLWARVHRLLG